MDNGPGLALDPRLKAGCSDSGSLVGLLRVSRVPSRGTRFLCFRSQDVTAGMSTTRSIHCIQSGRTKRVKTGEKEQCDNISANHDNSIQRER